jgi:hypothetical protein
MTQIVAGRGLSAASVAIDPAPFRGVLPLPISALKSGSPVLGNPANRNRAVPLTYDQTPGVTEIVEIKGRGHALTIDSGWREVADTALAFVKRFV